MSVFPEQGRAPLWRNVSDHARRRLRIGKEIAVSLSARKSVALLNLSDMLPITSGT
jgi:hypothetical protein